MALILGWTGKQVNELELRTGVTNWSYEQELRTSDFANPFTETG